MLACLIALSASSLVGAAAVFASGTSTSAGDQQYVDPLTGTTTTSHPSGSSGSSSSSSSSSSGSSSAGSSSSTSNTQLSQTTQSTQGSGTSSSSDSSGAASSTSGHSGTLPFTGLNLWACAAIGLGLLGAGLVLRRAVGTT